MGESFLGFPFTSHEGRVEVSDVLESFLHAPVIADNEAAESHLPFNDAAACLDAAAALPGDCTSGNVCPSPLFAFFVSLRSTQPLPQNKPPPPGSTGLSRAPAYVAACHTGRRQAST